MNNSVKRLVRAGFRRLGYDLYRTRPSVTSSAPPLDLWPWLRDTQRIRTVIDIGANNGDFADFLASYFNPTSVYAFEPLASCIPDLERKCKTIRGLRIFNLALADYT